MLFSSHTFIFAFLPATLIVYAIVRRFSVELANSAVLVAASAIFYAYFRIDYAILLFASISANYIVGNWLQRRPNRNLLIAGIVANLALLGYFKYYNFFISQFNAVAGADVPLLNLVLPLGISFHTFQQVAYLIDCQGRRIGEQSFIRYILFVTFFPQLIAGPIVHHSEMMPQFAKDKGDSMVENLAIGLTIFAIGLFKKTVIADSLDYYSGGFEKVAQGFPITLIDAWSIALAYTLQIYFDFSAYSDMAIGLARMFGIVMPVNFLSPYKAVNIADFWHRWHITLSRWLRDYLYIPLGGNRKGKTRRYINLMLTMLLGGLWHGAGWTYVLWGGLHGAYLVIFHAWRALVGERVRLPKFVAVLLTFICVVFAWVPFRAPDLATTFTVYKAMIGLNGFVLPQVYASRLTLIQPLLDLLHVQYVDKEMVFEGVNEVALFVVLLAVVWCLPNVIDLFQGVRPALLPKEYTPVRVAWPWQPRVSWAVAGGLIGCLAIAGIDRIVEFIYFQF